MTMPNVFLFLFAALIGLSSTAHHERDDKEQIIYIKGVRCNYSSIVYPNVSCFPKSYNRSFSTVNAFAVLKQPIEKLWVRIFYSKNRNFNSSKTLQSLSQNFSTNMEQFTVKFCTHLTLTGVT